MYMNQMSIAIFGQRLIAKSDTDLLLLVISILSV